jgi:ASC-1-like (ASCH) protein
VNHVVRYSCFAEMLDMETLRLVLPGVQNLQQGIQVFRQWYSKSLESKHGVGAVRFTKTS